MHFWVSALGGYLLHWAGYWLLVAAPGLGWLLHCTALVAVLHWAGCCTALAALAALHWAGLVAALHWAG